MKLSKLYSNRFSKEEIDSKDKIWQVLCNYFFQKYIPTTATVLDLAGGYCEFINNIKCKKKIVVDLNKDVTLFANKDVEIHIADIKDIDFIEPNSIDIVFTSNFFEHIDKKSISEIILKVNTILKKDTGRFLILGPNIKYTYKEYWDFFDHHTPLTDKSVCEVLQMNGFEIEESIAKFLPYSTKSNLPKNNVFIKTYLKIPFIWRFFGKQFFIVAKKI